MFDRKLKPDLASDLVLQTRRGDDAELDAARHLNEVVANLAEIGLAHDATDDTIRRIPAAGGAVLRSNNDVLRADTDDCLGAALEPVQPGSGH